MTQTKAIARTRRLPAHLKQTSYLRRSYHSASSAIAIEVYFRIRLISTEASGTALCTSPRAIPRTGAIRLFFPCYFRRMRRSTPSPTTPFLLWHPVSLGQIHSRSSVRRRHPDAFFPVTECRFSWSHAVTRNATPPHTTNIDGSAEQSGYAKIACS